MTSYFVAGGAGFIGSNLIRRILEEENDSKIIIYDNFTSGKKEGLNGLLEDGRLMVIEADIKDIKKLTDSMNGCEVIYQLASNPDISKAVKQPDIDFWEGTYLVSNILEAMRINGIKKLIYPSGSGVYGEVGKVPVKEDFAPMLPISTYGASKMACEALICSYCYMFGINAAAFRFANVVGPKQTHGVGYDFIKKLKADPSKLEILGDGTQDKSYIYISDILNAVRMIEKKYLNGFNYYNVANLDSITVKDIADIVTRLMGLKNVKYSFSGGDRGWKGDVPKIYLDSSKIRTLGWESKYSSKQAIEMSVKSMIAG